MLTKPKIYTQNSKRQSHGFFWQAPEEPWLGLRRTAKALPTKEIYLGLHIGESRSRLVSVGRYALLGVGRAQDLFTLEPIGKLFT